MKTEIIIKMVFDRWNTSIQNCDNLLQILSDETLMRQITPGKNRGIYLLGHLIAVHDDMIILLGMGNKMYPELNETFLKSPDNVMSQMPSVADLRIYWKHQCDLLKEKFIAISNEEWFKKHTAVSEEDFVLDPHRNKLNIIITRTTHLQYHLGQLILLK